MNRRMPRWPAVRRFWRNRDGASMVEFGFIAVPFLGLLLGILDTSLVYFNAEAVEAAVQDAARNIMTGEAQAAKITTGAQFVSTYLCPATGRRLLPSYIDCSTLIVDVRAASSFSSADMSRTFYKDPSTLQFCPGSPGTINVVRVAYAMPAIAPILGMVGMGNFNRITSGLVNDVPNNPGWKHLVVGTAVFQTEPYPSSTYSANTGC